MYAAPPILNLVVLRSPDIDRAANFYRQLGLLFTRHAHGSGPEHYTSEVCGTVFEIYPMTEKTQPTISTRIGFSVDSVDQLVPLVEKIGARVLVAPCDSEWGRRAVVKDLDGHTVELVTPKDREVRQGQAGG
jgi:catechol 2,3-dioxygenase-like lactoylglutathione lyase family enzyme